MANTLEEQISAFGFAQVIVHIKEEASAEAAAKPSATLAAAMPVKPRRGDRGHDPSLIMELGGYFRVSAIGTDAAHTVAVDFGEVQRARGIDRQRAGPIHGRIGGGDAGRIEIVHAAAGDGRDSSVRRDATDAVVLLVRQDELPSAPGRPQILPGPAPTESRGDRRANVVADPSVTLPALPWLNCSAHPISWSPTTRQRCRQASTVSMYRRDRASK